ncbi:MAG TPA: hypothetical protein PKE26_13860 [Kiritimatiellia bacterium]|nr:hypothetical protein [Kiritimatiellia bacterium]HMP00188.1 hypothetical protein [Kiritimatiellia bacterium]
MTNTSRVRIDTVVLLLESVARNVLDATTALEQWPDIDSEVDDLVASAWHDVSHYATDKDIRIKDPSYAAYQAKSLLDRAQKIRDKYGR